MSRSVGAAQWLVYVGERKRGTPYTVAARKAGIGIQTAHRFEERDPRSSGIEFFALLPHPSHPDISTSNVDETVADLPDPRPHDQLGPEARHALTDFGYFRRRYFGHISSPWQEEAANRIVELLETDHHEYVVLNCPPGSGKSTTFTLDIPAWMTARDRAIRGLMGSAAEVLASRYTNRLRRDLDRRTPAKAKAHDLKRGLAVDAETTLIDDFGRFRPLRGDIWRREEFIVAQVGDESISEKEATWTAYGMDSAQLGNRYEFVIWDDLVTNRTMRTAEGRQIMRTWYEDEAETRLEVGGVFILQGQRLSSDDLYRFALDMKADYDNDDGEVTVITAEEPRKYHHIVFKAHDEDRCTGKHPSGMRPWPDSCLLDPKRMPWRLLATKMKNGASKFRVLYQQEDFDPEHVLVNPLWVDGGVGPDGVDYPGCWDDDRAIGELPDLPGQTLSVATVDPSPTKFWSIQWWLYHPESEQRFLIDIIRQQMDAPELLDYDHNNRVYTGVMVEWQERSRQLGRPITQWIVEANAAQRFMLQYDFVKKWRALNRVDLMPHATHVNKADPNLGVDTVGPHWRYGRVRLPGSRRHGSREKAMFLVNEATTYPDGKTDDCVMGQWFLEWNLPNLTVPDGPVQFLPRPDWMRRSA